MTTLHVPSLGETSEEANELLERLLRVASGWWRVDGLASGRSGDVHGEVSTVQLWPAAVSWRRKRGDTGLGSEVLAVGQGTWHAVCSLDSQGLSSGGSGDKKNENGQRSNGPRLVAQIGHRSVRTEDGEACSRRSERRAEEDTHRTMSTWISALTLDIEFPTGHCPTRLAECAPFPTATISSGREHR